MNLKFAKSGKTMIYKIIKMTVMSQKDLILNPKTGRGLRPCGNVCSKVSV